MNSFEDIFKSDSARKIAVMAFFTLLFLLGLYIYRDFGLTCDEPLDRNTAIANLKYVLTRFLSDDTVRSIIPGFDAIKSLDDFVDHDYGVVFHLPSYIIELLFYKDNYQEAFKARHLLNFIYVYCGLIGLYAAIASLFKKRSLGLMAVLLFLLSPRFFAESFYNGKDLIVVAFACINLYTLIRVLDRPCYVSLALHALSTALIIDTRIIGVAYLATTMGLLCVKGLLSGNIKEMFKSIIFYAVLSFVLVVVFFPYLWADPFGRFIGVFKSMSAFRHDGLILFNGDFYSVHDVPKSYIPVWIAITLPPFILSLFILGVVAYLQNTVLLLKNKGLKAFNNKYSLFLLYALVIITGSVGSIIVLHSSLYNGWRQLYFLYPEMIAFAVFALSIACSMRSGFIKYAARAYLGLCLLGALSSGAFIIKTHPYQNVYFNGFANKPWTFNYDVDYWGNATHLAYEYLLNKEPGTVLYCHESMIFRANRNGLQAEDLDRLVKVPCNLAKYRINNFFGRDEQDYIRLRDLKGKRIFTLEASGEIVLEVLERK